MNSIVCFLALLICVAKGSERPRPRLINAQVAQDHQFKYTVGISFHNVAFIETWCSGALISPIWVLTAAHCVHGQRSAILYFGNRLLRQGYTRHVHMADMIYPSEYIDEQYHHDIALIRVSPIHYANVVPIALPRNGFHLDFGSIATISGWGSHYVGGNLSATLMYGDVQVISNNLCKSIYNPAIIDNTILCTTPHLGVATCHGDSGGALVLKSLQVLIGIAAFTDQNECAVEADGYTRITSHLHWLQSHTGIQT